MNRFAFTLILLYLLNTMQIIAVSSVRPTGLKTDHLEHPIGIDNPSPRFMWQMEDNRAGARQMAYRIVVGSDSLAVVKGKGDFWDTGKIHSDNRLITYAGKQLDPFTRYYWTVTIWDRDEVSYNSYIDYFETGMMDSANWQGSWIGDGHDIHFKPATYFRKAFTTEKEILTARAYIAVAGLFELYINGERVGDQRLNPMYTRFDRRTLYVTHDVTTALQQGENAVGILLGNGWYNHQSKAVWDFDRAPWRNRPAFCIDLRITYSDGTNETFSSDLSWKKSEGPLLFNSIYTGEHYDARLELDGWCNPGFDDAEWQGVTYRSAPSTHITSQQITPIRHVRTFPAQSFHKIGENRWLYDFGQNMSGVTRIKVGGLKGTEVRIGHGERLDEKGRLDLSNIDVYYRGDKEREPFQTDILWLSGNGEDEYTTRFNYKGFRYVEVSASEPLELDGNSLTAFFMHSDVQPVGRIETSSELINQLWTATNNAYLSNLMGYPTDCPQREKNGWTGDGHFAIETALYNFDGFTVYEKWLADHRDEQQPNGVLPDIIPTGGWGYGKDNGLDWTSTIAIIPWNLYLFYGDLKPLADNYENIKKYVDYVDRNSPEHLTSWGRGDWVPVRSRSNLELTSSVYFYVDAVILSETAMLLGFDVDHHYYAELAKNIREAINNRYLDRDRGIYASGTQTELSVPLQWKVVPEELITKVSANLAKKVEENGFHLDVGVLGAKAILNALSENGHFETAYKVATQDRYPSWGWWIVNGATTLLENWDLEAERDISDNHMMFGEIGAWFFKGMGGIFPDPDKPGFKNVILKPNFTKELEFFTASFDSPFGTLVSHWYRDKGEIIYEVTVPANSSATLTLPDYVKGENRKILKAGTHTFRLNFITESGTGR